MRLVYTKGRRKGKEVKVGDEVRLEYGPVLVKSFSKPHKPASSGKVVIELLGGEQQFYVSVIGAEWIEREDRGEVAPS